MVDLDQDVKFVKGVGPNRVKLLNKLNIHTLKDLITYYPREYEDRSKPTKIANAIEGEETLIQAICVSKMNEIRTKRKNMTIYKLIVRDDTASAILTWYNQGYLKSKFKLGQSYSFYGKVTKKNGNVEMMSPTFDEEGKNKNTGKIIPIYPLTYQLSQNAIRQIIENGLNITKGQLDETLPDYLINEYNLLSFEEATNKIHFPGNFDEFNLARKRLVFEELLSMQIALLSLKNQYTRRRKGYCIFKRSENVRCN
jgi:ATP-dependent DNA helicase RecG